jgi:hypothetical protein
VTKKLVVAAVAAMVWISTAAISAAQPPEAPQPKPLTPGAKSAQNIPLELQVVISRYQGDKRISSLPYVLSLKSAPISQRRGDYGAVLRLMSRVPVRTQLSTPSPADGKPAPPMSSVNYENVGTNIDVGATAMEDGRFEVTIVINESSVVTDPQDLKGTPGSDSYPVFRSYQSTNTLFVKDGQTSQFTAASDRVSGEVVRVEVKLTVLK